MIYEEFYKVTSYLSQTENKQLIPQGLTSISLCTTSKISDSRFILFDKTSQESCSVQNCCNYYGNNQCIDQTSQRLNIQLLLFCCFSLYVFIRVFSIRSLRHREKNKNMLSRISTMCYKNCGVTFHYYSIAFTFFLILHKKDSKICTLIKSL